MMRAEFRVELTWPPDELLIVLVGIANTGWFRMLNISARNCRAVRSVIGNIFKSVKSTCLSESARRVFRPPLPYVNVAGTVKVLATPETKLEHAEFAET